VSLLNEAPRLTYITDTRTIVQKELFDRLERLVRRAPSRSHRFAVQLRDPQLSGRELMFFAKELRTRTRELGIRLIVNDRADVAHLVGAHGLHLGRESITIDDARRLFGPSFFISIACHSAAEVVQAANAGATACTLSPIFASPQKGAPLGLEAIREARSLLSASGVDIGLVALGGIDSKTAGLAIDAGADGVAAIRSEIDPSLFSA
jgi:thiamine-phosphate pyrophosphorylase